MKTSVRLLIVMLLATANAGCSPVDAEKKMVEYRENPKPKQAYKLTMRIDNAPGPFASTRALAQYDVVNKECLRPPNDNPGGYTSPVPTEDIEIPLTKVSENEYAGMVYADWMLDEDYNGRGVCRWELIQFRVRMKATGAEEEARFVPSIMAGQLLSLEEETIYLSKQAYPRDGEIEDMPVYGRADRASMNPSIRDEDLFTVTFTPSKVVPL